MKTARVLDLMVLTEAAVAALQGATRSILLPDMPPPALVVKVVSPGITSPLFSEFHLTAAWVSQAKMDR